MSDLYRVNIGPPGGGYRLNSFCVESVLTRDDISNKIMTPNDVRFITIESEYYTGVEEDAFYDLTELWGVSIIDTLITEIPENLLIKAPNLLNIHFRGNNMRTIPENLVKFNTEMKSIDIHENNLEIIHKNTFYNNPKMEAIYLAHNNLEIIHKNTFYNNPKMEAINLAQNKLTFLPQELFEGNRKMNKIDISYNPISSIPLSISELPHLRTLDLTGTNVSKSNLAEIEYEEVLIKDLQNSLRQSWDQYKFKSRPLNIFVYASTYAQDIFQVQAILDGLNEYFYIGNIYHWDEFFGLRSNTPGEDWWRWDYEEGEFLQSDICIIFQSHMFEKIEYDEPHLEFTNEIFSKWMIKLPKHKISVSMNSQYIPLDFGRDNNIYTEGMNAKEITEVIAAAMLEYLDENI
jgi:hypothetical protein